MSTNANGSVWGDPRAPNLQLKLRRERLSAEQIAVEMCKAGHFVSRNAVIGKLRRMGEPLLGEPVRLDQRTARAGRGGMPSPNVRHDRPAPAVRPQKQAQSRPPVTAVVDAPSPPPPVEVAGPIGGIAILDAMGTDACRWPLPIPSLAGEGLALRVCGAPRQEGCSYCRKHLRDAYQPGTAATPRAPAEGRRSGENRAALASVVMGRAA